MKQSFTSDGQLWLAAKLALYAASSGIGIGLLVHLLTGGPRHVLTNWPLYAGGMVFAFFVMLLAILLAMRIERNEKGKGQ
jgi:membrane protein implicated in regulation of membrane protease activity